MSTKMHRVCQFSLALCYVFVFLAEDVRCLPDGRDIFNDFGNDFEENFNSHSILRRSDTNRNEIKRLTAYIYTVSDGVTNKYYVRAPNKEVQDIIKLVPQQQGDYVSVIEEENMPPVIKNIANAASATVTDPTELKFEKLLSLNQELAPQPNLAITPELQSYRRQNVDDPMVVPIAHDGSEPLLSGLTFIPAELPAIVKSKSGGDDPKALPAGELIKNYNNPSIAFLSGPTLDDLQILRTPPYNTLKFLRVRLASPAVRRSKVHSLINPNYILSAVLVISGSGTPDILAIIPTKVLSQDDGKSISFRLHHPSNQLRYQLYSWLVPQTARFRIIGGSAATASGAPISNRGRRNIVYLNLE